MGFLTNKNLQGEGRLQRSLGLYRFGFGCHCCCSSSDFLVAGRLDQGRNVWRWQGFVFFLAAKEHGEPTGQPTRIIWEMVGPRAPKKKPWTHAEFFFWMDGKGYKSLSRILVTRWAPDPVIISYMCCYNPCKWPKINRQLGLFHPTYSQCNPFLSTYLDA